MGTITSRRRNDGTEGHTAVIRIKQGGRIIHRETQTFDRLPAARLWLRHRETELAQPGALAAAKVKDPLLKEVIGQYIRESKRELGRTKRQVLAAIGNSALGGLRCSEVDSPAVVQFARGLKVQPQTVANYMAHLGSISRVARPAWGYPLANQAVLDARMVLEKMGGGGRPNMRERRPTLDELNALLRHYTAMAERRKAELPMVDLILFAMFSSRRQEEVTRITWADLDEAHSEVIVRDMKHPGEKLGNDVRTTLPDPALAVIRRQPRTDARIFPYNAKSVSASFTRACALLGIDDLHFHDLRHECVSWLFERGWNIPHVATVSGHRSRASLKRYAQIRQVGDKYEGWAWLPVAPK